MKGGQHAPAVNPLKETENFIVFLVDAKHLDYSNSQALIKSLQKHHSFGHAWIKLHGDHQGQSVDIEGGHSGELGCMDPKYFDGIMNYIEYGDAKYTRGQPIRYEPNPIKYLWSTLQDGFYQEGAGGHRPTFAAKVDITPEQFNQILEFIDPFNYCYANYSLTHHQCTTFLVQIAALIGIILPSEVTIPIAQQVRFSGTIYHLWSDPIYAELTLPSPDILEQSLIQLVEQGQAEDVSG